MYRPLDAFLLRAPLLPEAALARGARALVAHPLGARAIEIASSSLAAARPGAKRDRALARYARRAAFRATPSGLLAGVCMGRLGRTTAIATGTPEAYLAPSWASVHEAARAMLDDADVRERTRLRAAPSAMRDSATVRWIGPGEPFGELRTGELDERLAAVLDVTARWARWPDVRARLDADDPAGADELLLLLLDEGLLESDLSPPLIGPPAAVYLQRKLAAIGCAAPTSGPDRLHAVLVHRPARPPVLDRAAVERAAELVPLLLALNDALAPPVAERFAQPELSDALDAVTETFGAGAFDLGALAAGDYGVDVGGNGDGDGDDLPTPGAPPSPAAVTLLLTTVAEALREGRREAALDAAALAALPAVTPPPTAELFVAPTTAPAAKRGRMPPGTGWLIGLHAPAGASFGRFAHALGPAMDAALSELDAAERQARPEVEVVDVAFAPSVALADLVAHPPVRRRTLAISSWTQHDDVATADLDLVADPTEPDALALRARGSRKPVVPSPLARVRSATAPAGVFRLLAGWSLLKQQTSWAVPLGPLAKLAFVPRLTLEGFVVCPASWRLPRARDRAALRRWRQAQRVPRHVQVGDADELLPVDLDGQEAASDLARHDRVFEIWPPRGAVVDRDGRRVEAVVLLVGDPSESQHRIDRTVRAAGDVAPPRRQPAAAGWRTFRLYGAGRHQDAVLAAVVATVTDARAAGEIDRWFYLPYVDGPGRRPHVRLRVHAAGGPEAFEHRLRAQIAEPRLAGVVTALETGDYHPETGRFDPTELAAVHALFEADSELCATLRSDDALDRATGFARAADALARGLGLDLAARHALARDRRDAAERSDPLDDDRRRESDELFRAAGRDLRAALAGDPAPLFADHAARVAAAAAGLPVASVARLLPTLLHLSAVRLLGADVDGERLGYTFWERTLLGLSQK